MQIQSPEHARSKTVDNGPEQVEPEIGKSIPRAKTCGSNNRPGHDPSCVLPGFSVSCPCFPIFRCSFPAEKSSALLMLVHCWSTKLSTSLYSIEDKHHKAKAERATKQQQETQPESANIKLKAHGARFTVTVSCSGFALVVL